MTTPVAASQWAGRLYLQPGAEQSAVLRLERQDWAGRLAPGRAPDELPGLLANVFNLCGHAHRLCARLAVLQARGLAAPVDGGAMESLRRETVAEHLRRIALDWPRYLNVPDAAGAAVRELTTMPVPTARAATDGQWMALREWLAAHWFGQPLSQWLARWRAEGAVWLRQWADAGLGWLPRAVAAARMFEVAVPIRPENALTPQTVARIDGVSAIATAVPPRHTGCWSRAIDPRTEPLTPWALLGARLADLAALCLDDGDSDGCGAARLTVGACQMTVPGRAPTGMAWVETSRGLLAHRVELGVPAATGDTSIRVNSCAVFAPTDWNCHALGPFAQAVSAASANPRETLGLLLAAFDPCVPVDGWGEGASHA